MALVALLTASTPATAQLPAEGATLQVAMPAHLEPGTATQVPVVFEVGCAEIALSGSTVLVDLEAAPSWLAVDGPSWTVGLLDCLGLEKVTLTGQLNLTPTAEAPGLEPFTVDALGRIDDHEYLVEGLTSELLYRPGHTMDPSGDQTFTVDGPTYTFDLQVEITANAKTMVMFEDKVVSGQAFLTGLRAKVFDVPNGERTATLPITFEAPEGPWTEETATFYNYSHCLGGEDCGEELARTITWTFVNADPDAGSATTDQPHDGGKEGKGTPGLALPGLVASVAVGARLARRGAKR